MSLRTSPQTGVAAQLSATKERYRCGVPLAGAIRPPFGTARMIGTAEGNGLPRQGFALPRNDSCK